MTSITSSASPQTPLTLSDLDDGEVIAMATGILMVRYQLAHDQARTALVTRAERARLDLRAQAEQIVASQDRSIRRWVAGPEAGAFDGARFAGSGSSPLAGGLAPTPPPA